MGEGGALENLSQRQTIDLALSKVQWGFQSSRPQTWGTIPHVKTVMDLLHSWGVELVVYLQTSYSGYQDVFSVASTVADLHTTFFFFFPVWFHLRRDAALRLIWVAVLGDWINLVLKWYEVTEGHHPEAKRQGSICIYCVCLSA